MSWTTPKTWTNEPLAASDMNTYISDNLAILKTPVSAVYTANESSNYTTNSLTFTNVDTTDTEGKFRHTLVTNGGDIFVHLHCNINTSAGADRVWFDLTVDGVQHGGDDGIIGVAVPATTAPGIPVTFTRIITGLSVGSHVFRLQWKVDSGTTATLYAGAGTGSGDLHPQFWAREIS